MPLGEKNVKPGEDPPPNLDFSPFHDRPVQLLSCSVGLRRALKRDESEALRVDAVTLFTSEVVVSPPVIVFV